MLLDFINLGGAELAIIAAILLAPAIFIIYCVVDIVRSHFKTALLKPVFLLLVILAPFIGGLIYVLISRNYKKAKPGVDTFA